MAEKELVERLEKLERDNRRLKGFAVAALILAAALGAIYATRPVPDVIKAHEFDVVDRAGNVRAEMRMNPAGEPDFAIFDQGGRLRGSLYVDAGGSSQVALYGKGGNVALRMSANPDASGVILFAQMKPKFQLPLVMEVTPGGQPGVTLRDGQGFTMDLGSTGAVAPTTGAAERTSAASIIMFGNDKKHHVIWKAP
jgi:hypothetical protein